MTKLYSALAKTYHEMYQSLYDYQKEFRFFDKTLRKYKVKSVLEIGCGSGNLASSFLEKKYSYVGLDLFKEMIDIAKKVCPHAKFVKGDMRNITLKEKFDAIIISGTSFTYMVTNEDVLKCLKSIHSKLKNKGILIFDNFNAYELFTHFREKTVNETTYKGTSYKRVSKNSWNFKTGWCKNWQATYYIKEKGKKTKIVKDKSILRAFTKDELSLFLELCGFKVIKTIDQGIKMTTIAQKK